MNYQGIFNIMKKNLYYLNIYTLNCKDLFCVLIYTNSSGISSISESGLGRADLFIIKISLIALTNW